MHQDPFAIRLFSPRNLLCLLAVFGLYSGYLFRNPQLLFLGIFALSTLVISIVQALRLLPDATVERSHPGRAFEQQTIPVKVEITSPTRRGASLVLVEDSFPVASLSKFRHLILEPFRKGEHVVMSYLAYCNNRRGIYTNGPLRLEAYDPLGLMRRSLMLPCFTDVLLYPNTAELELFQVLGNGTLKHVGFETLVRAGDSTEFTGVRPYRQGDAKNRIHWKLASRSEELYVKEFQESIVTDVSIFLDCGRLGLTGLGEQTSMEYAIKAAASVARVAIEKIHLVQLMMFSNQVEHIPLGSGRNHLLMMLDRLSFVKAEHESHFAERLLNAIPLLRRGGTAVVIQSITLIDHTTLDLLVAACESRQIKLILIGIDDRAFIKLYREQETRHVEALSVDDMTRELALRGVRVHVVRKARVPLKGLRNSLEADYSLGFTAPKEPEVADDKL